jgi:hypothetical protein
LEFLALTTDDGTLIDGRTRVQICSAIQREMAAFAEDYDIDAWEREQASRLVGRARLCHDAAKYYDGLRKQKRASIALRTVFGV